MPRSQIEVFAEVIQDDGSAFAVALNAVLLAVVDAGIPVRDVVTATTVTLASISKTVKKPIVGQTATVDSTQELSQFSGFPVELC